MFCWMIFTIRARKNVQKKKLFKYLQTKNTLHSQCCQETTYIVLNFRIHGIY